MKTIYEVITPGSVIPRTIVVIQPSRTDRSTSQDEVHIQRNCKRRHRADLHAIVDCIRQQGAAFQELTQISEGVASDAGLTNIVEICLSVSKLEEGYDWQAAKQCYDKDREAFAEIYGR